MREKEFKQLFERLVLAAAAPIPLVAIVSSCSGEVQGTSPATGGSLETGGSAVTSGGSSSTTATKGLGGFLGLGTFVRTGGTSNNTSGGGSTAATTKGIGGFLGTVVMTGGTSNNTSAGGTTSTTSAPQVVTCPDAVASGTGGAGTIGCGTPYCVLADVSGLGTSPLDSATCSPLCGTPALLCLPVTASVLKCSMPCTGRRPGGLSDVESFCGNELGQYFSEVAHLEAASVPAFRALGRQLSAYGAPRSLRQAARRATRDEIHHTRLTRACAERFGGRYLRPTVSQIRDVTLEVLARENAVEGCVRETYGALLATYQARNARDPAVRGAMREIARDETRHAAIAWAIARWVEPKLDAAARQRVREARQTAVTRLINELRYQAPPSLQQTAGVPNADTAQSMARALASELWA